MSRYSNRKYSNNAEWLRKYNVFKKLAIALIILLALIMLLTFIGTAVYNKFGSFTINIQKLDMTQYGITLSESPTDRNFRSTLNASPVTDAVDTSLEVIRGQQNLDGEGGNHNDNAKRYFAYTFYCINISNDNELIYNYSLNVKNVTKRIDEAVRIMVYVNGEEQGIYGKQELDGSVPLLNGEKLDTVSGGIDRSEENQAKMFTSNVIMSGEIHNFKPNDYTKFTVVMWFEGTDPDCTNERMGGTIRLDMEINVIRSEKVAKD